MFWFGLLAIAMADEPTTLPAGSASVYSGVGVSTFRRLNDSLRDRSVKARLDLYGSYGLHDRLQLSLSAPLLYGTVVDDPDTLPCPGVLASEGYCDPYVTVGPGRLDLRSPLVRGPFRLALGMGLQGDPWNRRIRGRYASPGTGTLMVAPYLLMGPRLPLADDLVLSVTAGGSYVGSLAGKANDGFLFVRAPSDAVQALGQVRLELPGPLAAETGVAYDHRLAGLALGPSWQASYFPQDDRWNVLRTRLLTGTGKVSVDLPQSMGLHLAVTWLYEVEEGPTDLVDVSLGWHKYFAPR